MNLQQANKNVEKTKQFYERYIEQCIAQYGNSTLCEKLGVSNKTLLMALERGSMMSLKRWANRIADTMSAQDGSKDQ